MALANWFALLLAVILLIAAALAIVRMLNPKSIDGGTSNIGLTILAVIGVLALLGVGAMVLMHGSMGGMMGR